MVGNKNKRFYLFVLAFAVITSIFVYAQSYDHIPKEKVEYQGIYKCQEELLGYEQVYQTKTIENNCLPQNKSCPATLEVTVDNRSLRGDGVYSDDCRNIIGFKTADREFDIDQESEWCFLCPTDTSYALCYDKKHGGSKHASRDAYCTPESGTKGVKRDSKTWNVIESFGSDSK